MLLVHLNGRHGSACIVYCLLTAKARRHTQPRLTSAQLQPPPRPDGGNDSEGCMTTATISDTSLPHMTPSTITNASGLFPYDNRVVLGTGKPVHLVNREAIPGLRTD